MVKALPYGGAFFFSKRRDSARFRESVTNPTSKP